MTRARDLAAFVSNADGDIKFDTDTLFIDSSANRVGIGTTTPDRSLHIAGNPGMIVLEDTGGSTDDKRAALFADSGAFEIASKNDDDSTRLNDIFVADLGTGAIRMGDTGGTSTSRQKSFIISHQTGQSSEYGGLEFFRAHENSQKVGASIMHVRPGSSLDDSDMVFKTSSTNANATERMRILHSGGLTFNGDTAAANALNDYEEGTWTPALTVAGDTSGITYVSRSGAYVKIGELVYAEGDIQLLNKGSNSGSVKIDDFPFNFDDRTAGTSLDGGAGVCAFQSNGSGIHGNIGLIGSGGNDFADLRIATVSGGDISNALQASNLNNSFSIRFSITYRAA